VRFLAGRESAFGQRRLGAKGEVEEEGVGWTGIPTGQLVAGEGPADLDEEGERR
jgi:hypothetical protein